MSENPARMRTPYQLDDELQPFDVTPIAEAPSPAIDYTRIDPDDPYCPTVLREPAAAAVTHTGPSTMTDAEILVQSVLDAGVAELVDADTSDEVIAALVTAAELGHRQPIPGLTEALTSIREAELDEHAQRMELADVLADIRAASGVQIASLVTAAEAGRGGAIEGLARALVARMSEEMARRQ
jgi:hypothetical protein